MNRLKTTFNNTGFMLSELLVVIAIMAILAGVSFVAVSSYIRGLQALEMDETAKEMFIAAQNHLSSAYASGEYQEELEKSSKISTDEANFDFGIEIPKPDYIDEADVDKAGKHDYRVVFHTAETAESPKKKILNYMLPQYAIDSEVSDKGNYMIVYEVNSGTVLSVFYSGNSHTAFGGQSIYTFSEDDINSVAINDAVKIKANRKSFTDNTVIGYFGGKNKDVIPGTKLKPLILDVKNGNKLTAIIHNINYVPGDSSQKIKLIVKGRTSNKKKEINLTEKNDNDIEFDLDDISTSGNHFNDLFGTDGFLTGEDIEVIAELSDNSSFSMPVESNRVTENSLFSSYIKDKDNEDSIAYLTNIRHLENLDPSISGFLINAKDVEDGTETKNVIAKQIKDIDYNDYFNECGIKIYDGLNKVIDNYYGIGNDDLKEYDGTNYEIRNIKSTSGNGGNSGIIGTVNRTDNKAFMMKNLDIVDSSFGSEDLTGSAGSAIGSASSSVELQNVTIKSTGSNAISIKGYMDGVEGAGGLIGKTTGSLTVNNSHIDANDLSIKGNNAGGIVGIVGGDCSITDSDVSGENLSTIGNTSGGLVGETDGPLKITNAYVIGKNTAISGNFAGGIAGYTAAKIDISDTFSTAYVYAESTNAGGIAGGFIGSINNATSGSSIKRCYVSGHTEDGIYGTKDDSLATADKRVENFNIIANFIAGGFIGDVDGSSNVKVEHSYTTASAYSSMYVYEGSNLGIAGGFVGKIGDGSNLTVNKVYSAGLVSIAENGTDIGGFIGTIGTSAVVSATDAYYLKGQYSIGDQKYDFNNFGASSSGAINNVTNTAGTEIAPATPDTPATAAPWDTTLGTTYPYKTVAQLLGKTDDEDKAFKEHIGDWVEVVEAENESNMFIRNAEKLAVIFKGKDFDGKTVSVMVEGLESGKTYYTRYKFNNNIIEPLVTHDVASNLYNHKNDLRDFNGIAKESADGGYDYYIFYDDITKQNGAFAHIFNCSKPGEDICITAKEGEYTSKELENFKKSGNKGTLVGITNSLFADGSNNANYKSADYYSDINPDYAIVKPVESKPSEYESTALVTNFRHLQNIDTLVSNVDCGIKPTKAKLCKDIYWKTTEDNPVPTHNSEDDEYVTDFLTAINNDNNNSNSITGTLDEVKIFRWNPVTDDVVDGNSFFGIENIYLSDFDGQNHSINNLYMKFDANDYGTNTNAGLFREVVACSNGLAIHNLKMVKTNIINSKDGDAGSLIGKYSDNNNLTITDVELIDSKIISEKQNAGGVIGEINVAGIIGEINVAGISLVLKNITIIEPIVSAMDNSGSLFGKYDCSGSLTANNIYSYGKLSIIKSTGDKGNAGGLIGQAYNGGYTISNCGASSYVYADAGKCAGGFIGDFKPKKETTIQNCFVGGHVSDNTLNTDLITYYPDYVNDVAVQNKDLAITREGGYNVYAKIAAGGFFGYIGTSENNSKTKIESCFSTASVNSLGTTGESGAQKKSAVGGFVGRMQPKNQTYTECYAAGRVFTNADLVGGFAGHNYVKDNNKPVFEFNKVLRGLDFNDSSSVQVISNEDYPEEELCYVTMNTDDLLNPKGLLNPNSDDVKVKTFNLGKVKNISDENMVYPFRDNARYYDAAGQNYPVFYGDWVEPSTYDRKIVDLENGNILKANILSTTETRKLYPADNTYYETYIRIYGKDSKSNVYFRVLYKNGSDSIVNHINIYKPEEFNEANNQGFNIAETCPSSKAIYDGKTLIFNIDDISKYKENYHGTMSWYGGKAGEDIYVYASSSLTEVMKDTSPSSAKVNSLFEELVPNDDGTNTYTAKISNARHLQNLDYEVTENTDYKISKVEQTDNIYWKDDGTFGTENYTAKTMPYLTEIPDATIYERNGTCQLTSAGKFMSLYLHQIQFNEGVDQTLVYDGKNHTLYNFDISNNTYAGDNAGLFAKLNNNLKVKDLIMKNPKVDQSAKSVSSGCLVGASNNYQITLDNIALQGEVKVTGINYAGGAVGSAKNIIINNLGHDGKMNVSNVTYGHVGGMVGLADGDMTVTNSYLIGTSYDLRSLSGSYSGGIVGKVGNKFDIKDSKIETTTLYVIANTGESNVGGFAGYVGGGAKITGSNLKATNATISGDDGNTKVGGYIGYVGGDATISTSNFTVTTATIDGKYGMSYVGGYIGKADAKATLEYSTMSGDLLSISCTGNSDSYAGGFVGLVNSDLTLTSMKIDYSREGSNGTVNVNSTCIYGLNSYAGGFIGHVNNGVTCTNSELVACNINIISKHATGGLFASINNSATISETSVYGGTVSIEGSKYIGGVIGTFEGKTSSGTLTINRAYGYGKVGFVKLNNNEGDSYLGGFIARTNNVSNMNITNSFSCFVIDAIGDANSTGVVAAGGFGGKLEVVSGGRGDISGCYSSGHYSNSTYDISTNSQSAGGFSGSLLGPITIIKCFTTQHVSVTNSIQAGGFAGLVGSGVTIKDGCYTVGYVTGTAYGFGAFIGYVTKYEPAGLSIPVIKNAYYFNFYPSDIKAIGSNDTGTSYSIEAETSNHYNEILGSNQDGTYITDTNSHVWDKSKIKSRYGFKNWIDTKLIYGEWDYENLPYIP